MRILLINIPVVCLSQIPHLYLETINICNENLISKEERIQKLNECIDTVDVIITDKSCPINEIELVKNRAKWYIQLDGCQGQCNANIISDQEIKEECHTKISLGDQLRYPRGFISRLTDCETVFTSILPFLSKIQSSDKNILGWSLIDRGEKDILPLFVRKNLELLLSLYPKPPCPPQNIQELKSFLFHDKSNIENLWHIEYTMLSNLFSLGSNVGTLVQNESVPNFEKELRDELIWRKWIPMSIWNNISYDKKTFKLDKSIKECIKRECLVDFICIKSNQRIIHLNGSLSKDKFKQQIIKNFGVYPYFLDYKQN